MRFITEFNHLKQDPSYTNDFIIKIYIDLINEEFDKYWNNSK